MSTNARAATWLRRFVNGALILLVIVSLFATVLARVVPMTGRSTFVVAGGSMSPAIGIGSAVIVDPISAGSIAVGDVVSLRSGPERAIFTHRVIRIADRDGAIWIETKGDANAMPDPSLTPATEVIGRVGVSIPAAGYLIALLSSPRGIVFVILLGLVLLFAGWMLESSGLADRRVVGERTVRDDGPVGSADPA